ncbi:class F sortase [Cellulomonas chengniuliangii]|uniref:Class F sortase n=1 Tax=Cellulomonas chengniuliangii TaxID=2968084 RepID=A0ABY5KXC6_9CELL|nr:class F sortase [Cellulomonas chengniuliangii]MCC2308874.1 class F sortase [Cellulomonas chengniuliangii]UUI74385.1 class F sortase [Cellulomonas chengniuliangii]
MPTSAQDRPARGDEAARAVRPRAAALRAAILGRRRGAARSLAVALVALGAFTACGGAPAGTSESGAAAPSATASTPPPAGDGSVPVADAGLGASTAPAVVPPVRVQVPDLEIDMPVEAVGVAPEGDMELPDSADVAAWYEYGPAPAAPEGSTLIAAHVDSLSTGIGPFARLHDVAPGAKIVVTTADGSDHEYSVRDVVRVPKDTAPVGEWFSREGSSRLVLVTCGGAFDRDVGHYAENVVVTAVPEGG